MLPLVCGALTLLAGVYVLTPLFKEPRGNLEVELLAETELDRLLNRKAIIYSNLKELEFEYKMGRLSDADFHRLEAGYKGEASLVLHKLDQLGVEKNLDETIEQEISARKLRGMPSGRKVPPAGEKCPACGSEVPIGKSFCSDCGHRI